MKVSKEQRGILTVWDEQCTWQINVPSCFSPLFDFIRCHFVKKTLHFWTLNNTWPVAVVMGEKMKETNFYSTKMVMYFLHLFFDHFLWVDTVVLTASVSKGFYVFFILIDQAKIQHFLIRQVNFLIYLTKRTKVKFFSCLTFYPHRPQFTPVQCPGLGSIGTKDLNKVPPKRDF